MNRERITLWLLDRGAYWTESIGEILAGPWYRLSGWFGHQWWERQLSTPRPAPKLVQSEFPTRASSTTSGWATAPDMLTKGWRCPQCNRLNGMNEQCRGCGLTKP